MTFGSFIALLGPITALRMAAAKPVYIGKGARSTSTYFKSIEQEDAVHDNR
eukprot:CAMPEP_0185279884 /NCGR_PEP_ID=MMETSP1359-20130426/64679_1 /TAXON_ID=552665 /ORGANISM="Bigelowiella longifila, Strain CCMP242" /LENGTH=50 /DNA_ID=CAMNT_0027874911 /DNA_START=74 /DNA_END=222 /DNA_ORIENTATION=+